MSFTREYAVKSVRKACRCMGCSTMIEIGQPATRWAGMTEGEFSTGAWHPECRIAEIDLNRLHDTMWYDEWSCLSEIENEDHEWLIADHPIVATRMGLTARDLGSAE